MNRGRDADATESRSGRPDAGGPQFPADGLALGRGIGRRAPRPDRRALYGSFTVHAGLIAVLGFTGVLHARDVPDFEVYRVRLLSPPAQVEGPPTPRPTVTQTIVAPPREERPPERPRPVPEVKRVEQTPVREPEPRPKEPEPVAGRNPDPKSPGGEGLDVDIPGQEFPFPEYLENIIRQISRYFRWTGTSNPTAVVTFFINRDGTVGGLDVAERSGDFRFDLDAMSAIEQAGRRGAFGRLPDGWLQDRLWVRFRFIPPGG